MSEFKNKVAFVTGGSRGMGAAISRRLAEKGANVVLTYNSSESEAYEVLSFIESTGQRGLAIQADNANPEEVKSAVEKTVAEFGRIDILINNAGIFDAKPIEEFTLNDFQKTLDINVRAVFVASQIASTYMTQGGRIISIGSNLAKRALMPGLSLYSLSKAALVGFTKALARDLGSRKITVNIIHPGSTNTAMNPADGEFSDMQRSTMCIPQYAEPLDVANLVAWLSSDEAQCITGSEITIDGGTNA